MTWSQSPIVGLEENNLPDHFDGYYFKDLNNELDKYVGTWKYTNGTTILTIQLVKREQIFSGTWYEDELHGEYRYVENGLEVVNYLPRLFDPSVTVAQHTIDGNKLVYKNYYPECTECAIDEKRVILKFSDRARMYLRSQILVQHFVENGVEKIKINLDGSGPMIIAPGDPTEPRVPYGEYILVKQN
jgi:hypothetical protein